MAPKATSDAQGIGDQDLWVESVDPRAELGTKVKTTDGRIFRYARNGAVALTRGQLQIAPAGFLQDDEHADIAVNTAAIGDETVTVTLGSVLVTANQYAGGYLVVNDDTGEGITYGIRSHPAADASASLVVTLSEPILIAFAAATTVTLVANKWNGVVISTTTQTNVPAGVPNINITISYYFWLQTGGVCSVLQSGTNTPTKGEPVTIGEATSGSVSGRDSIAEPEVGIGLDTAISGEYNPVYLTIDRD